MFPAYWLEQAAEQTVDLLEIRHDAHVTLLVPHNFGKYNWVFRTIETDNVSNEAALMGWCWKFP